MGLLKVGPVPNTATPDPVSSVSAPDKFADEKEPRMVAFPVLVIAPVRFAFVETVDAAIDVLHENPVPEVQSNALPEVLHEGTAWPDGVVAVKAPNNVFAVCVANCEFATLPVKPDAGIAVAVTLPLPLVAMELPVPTTIAAVVLVALLNPLNGMALAVIALLQPKPVPLVHFKALDDVEQLGSAKSEGVVAVSAPSTVLAVWFASVAVTAPVDAELLKIVPSPVNELTPPPPAVAFRTPPESERFVPSVTSENTPLLLNPASVLAVLVAIATVPVLVIGPPVKPVPVPTLVTVPEWIAPEGMPVAIVPAMDGNICEPNNSPVSSNDNARFLRMINYLRRGL